MECSQRRQRRHRRKRCAEVRQRLGCLGGRWVQVGGRLCRLHVVKSCGGCMHCLFQPFSNLVAPCSRPPFTLPAAADGRQPGPQAQVQPARSGGAARQWAARGGGAGSSRG